MINPWYICIIKTENTLAFIHIDLDLRIANSLHFFSSLFLQVSSNPLPFPRLNHHLQSSLSWIEAREQGFQAVSSTVTSSTSHGSWRFPRVWALLSYSAASIHLSKGCRSSVSTSPSQIHPISHLHSIEGQISKSTIHETILWFL